MPNIFPRLITLLCLAIVTSCASTVSPVDGSSAPDSNASFVAGRFGLEWDHSFMRMAAEIECDGVSTFIEMTKDSDVPQLRVFPIPTGNCYIVGLAPMGGIGDRSPTIDFGGLPQPRFKVEAGKIYYLGNFRTVAFYPGEGVRANPEYTVSWRGRYITIYYSAAPEKDAAALIHHSYPSLENLEVIAVNPLNKSSKKDAVSSASS